ncbi:MAG: hypothetical protein QGF46_05140, partial [Planctomycetota bacterium]|nr:hypothetical protein [Planctomycetota bacterium]
EISKQDAETMLMVAGEQRQVVQKLSRQKLTDHPATQISNFRWWSVVPLPVEVSDKAQYEFGDLYGEWKSNGDFKLEFQAPFWINSSSVNPHPTALGNSVQIGESTFEVDGLEIKSKISYEAGDVVEHIVVTNISGGGLYWPRKINSRKPYSAISFTIDYSKEKTWSDPDSLVIGLGGGCGGRYGCGPRRKPDASDLDRWFMAPGQTAEFSFRNKFDVQDFREEVYFYSREAIRGIDGIRGATHKFSVPLNYAPDFFPSSSKWDSISFDASFDKEKGYSHVICE